MVLMCLLEIPQHLLIMSIARNLIMWDGSHFFTAIKKSGAVLGPTLFAKLITAAATTALSPGDYTIYLLDNKGKIKYLDEGVLRKYLKEFPQLLTSFNKDFDKVFPKEFYDSDHFVTDEEESNKMAVLKDYLIKLDKVKSQQ